MLKWRRASPMQDEEHGIYFIRQRDRKHRSSRDLIIYDDKPSKITGEVHCAHVEIRLQRPDIIRRQGFKYAGDLIGLNPRKLFDHHITLKVFDPDEYAKPIIRKTVKHERMKNRSSKPITPFADQYRSTIPQRVRSLLKRAYQDRVQLVRGHRPGLC